MEEHDIPPVTEIGELLARDDEGTHLKDLLARLSQEKSSMEQTLVGKEAFESAEQILRSVWSMQHMDKLGRDSLPR